MKNVITRSLSGIVYVALIIGAIIAGQNWFYALCLLFALGGMLELQQMAAQSIKPAGMAILLRSLDIAAAVCVVSLISMFDQLFVIGGCIFLYFMLRFVLTLYDKRAQALKALAFSIMTLAYVAVPLMILSTLYDTYDAHNRSLVLFIFILIWLNDTGAYCFGCTLGRHKLYERLSPKKTWEGFVGGMAVSIAAAMAGTFLTDYGWNLWQWAGLGAVVSIFGTWGDLFESLIKRTFGVKDSGNIIPGHGGVLDRIDSLLFATPAVFAYTMLAL